jgi:pimeloyl-ACP methyl ester carboxylesterase
MPTNTLVYLSMIALGAALMVGVMKSEPPYLPWHNTSYWETLLSIYDRRVETGYYKNCESQYIDTTYGTTHIFKCGDPTHPPVLVFHGAGANALSFDTWLMPVLVDEGNFYAIAVDYVCDSGRSSPKDGNLKLCPKRDDMVGHWVRQILENLGISKASLIGYSYGCHIAMMTARFQSSIVDKMVFMAPTAIVAPIQWSWIWRSIRLVLYNTEACYKEFLAFMSSDPNFDFEKDLSDGERELMLAIRSLGATKLPVGPQPYDFGILQPVVSASPTLLQIGEAETVTDPAAAITMAQRAGIEYKVYPQGGHLMLMEPPANQIAKDAVEFLKSETFA